MSLEYTITDPTTGDCEDFTSREDAIREARQKDYTPVYIDIYDTDEQDIIDDIRIDNAGKLVIA